MPAKTSNVSFRIDTDIKNQADSLFAQLGLNMTTAFNIFLRQAIREGSIPFAVTINTPNAKDAALLEADRLLAAERSRLTGVRGYSVDKFQDNMREAIRKGATSHG
ncbi:MAG: type II toxin-antitoxin system RelB/DinJ family antitoxin [Oscillospiraceae bacterium]|nr:type II toxin-antitoxin system RelB/DinJ family antitoxin [Oscillospiraceae bacterium]